MRRGGRPSKRTFDDPVWRTDAGCAHWCLQAGRRIGTGALWHRGPHYGEIKRIYVTPQARGLKLGKRILDAIEEHARQHGFAAIKLETGTLQPEALGLFAKCGFVTCGPFADYPTDDPYSVFMEKRL